MLDLPKVDYKGNDSKEEITLTSENADEILNEINRLAR